MTEIRDWYDNRAREFAECSAVELCFLGLSPQAQLRLNAIRTSPLREHLDVRGKRVLEYGAGHGRMAFEWPGFAEYLGIDFAPRLVDVGNRRLREAGLENRAKIIVGDFSTPSGSRDWDVVGSLGGFPYASDPQKFLQTMAEQTRRGGCVHVDNYLSSPIWNPVRKLRWIVRPPTGGQARMYTEAQMREMFARVGLEMQAWIVCLFPMLDGWYGLHGWRWTWKLRDSMQRSRLGRAFGIGFIAVGRKV